MGFTDNGEQALPLGLRSRPPGWHSHGWLDGPEVARLPALTGNLPSGILKTAVHREVKVKVKLLVAQLCPTLFSPVGCSPPDSSVMEFSRPEYWNGLPCPPPGIELRVSVLRPRGRTQVSCIADEFFTTEPLGWVTGVCHISRLTAKLSEGHSWSLSPLGAGGSRGCSLGESDVGQTVQCLRLEKGVLWNQGEENSFSVSVPTASSTNKG